MSTAQPKSVLAALRDERARTIEMLSDAFAEDLFDVDEFESRVARAECATDIDTLVLLRLDIEPGVGASAALVGGSNSQALAEAQPTSKRIVSVLGAAERKGRWRVAKKVQVNTILGGAVLDFREALLAPGVSEIKVLACLGGIEIILPPGLAVECEGFGILGGFESVEDAAADWTPEQPMLRITGFTVLGGVEVCRRQVGESARDAKKRRRHESKEHRAALKQRAQQKRLK